MTQCYAKKPDIPEEEMIAAILKKLEADGLKIRYQEVGDWQQEEKPRK